MEQKNFISNANVVCKLDFFILIYNIVLIFLLQYKLHEGEIRAWLTFKKERAARLAREERLRKAATRIQAWWRGVMVRRALGSFRYLKNMKKIGSKAKKK